MQNSATTTPTPYIEEDEIDLRELFATIWKGRKFIALFVAGVTFLTLIYVLGKPNIYASSTILVSQSQSGLSSKLGGLGALAGLAGVDIGGGSELSPAAFMQIILADYNFHARVIEEFGLAERLAAQEQNLSFALGISLFYDLMHSTPSEEELVKSDIFGVVKAYQGMISFSEDKKSGSITMEVKSPNRYFAKEVLELYLTQMTAYYRTLDMAEVDKQLEYYQTELLKTEDVQLKTNLSELISSLVQKKVLGQASRYYMFKQVTQPRVASLQEKVSPKRGLILVVAFVTAGIMAIFLIFLREFLAKNRQELPTT